MECGVPSLVGKLGKSQSSVEKLKSWMKREGSGGQLFSFSQGNEWRKFIFYNYWRN